MDQWNKIEGPELNLHRYSHVIFDEEYTLEKEEPSVNCWEEQIFTCRMKLDPRFPLYIKKEKFKVVERSGTLKSIKENLGKTL